MTQTQKIIKYCAITLAVLLVVGIISGIVQTVGWLFLLTDDDKGDDAFYDMQALITDYDGEDLSLDIDIGASDLVIRNGEKFEVSSNGRYIKCLQRGERIVIEERPHISFGIEAEVQIIITLPEGFAFEKVDMDLGAGNVEIDVLSCRTLDLDLGAGNFSAESLSATKRADIDGGAGKILIGGGSLSDLELDMGVGELYLHSELLGNSDLDMGVGNVKLWLLGDKSNYKLDIDKGIGEVRFDGSYVSGGVFGNGARRVDIDGGIGKIEVYFGMPEESYVGFRTYNK